MDENEQRTALLRSSCSMNDGDVRGLVQRILTLGEVRSRPCEGVYYLRANGTPIHKFPNGSRAKRQARIALKISISSAVRVLLSVGLSFVLKA